jgi:hypothetical protein
MQPFQRYIKINSNHMRYLYQKAERALPGNLQNRKYSFLLPLKCNISYYVTSFVLLLSLVEHASTVETVFSAWSVPRS